MCGVRDARGRRCTAGVQVFDGLTKPHYTPPPDCPALFAARSLFPFTPLGTAAELGLSLAAFGVARLARNVRRSTSTCDERVTTPPDKDFSLGDMGTCLAVMWRSNFKCFGKTLKIAE